MPELQRTLTISDRQYNFISVVRPGHRQRRHWNDGLLEAPGQNPNISLDDHGCSHGGGDFPRVPELRNPQRQAQCLQAIDAALREAA